MDLKKREAISKIGFWFNFEAGPSLKPQAYASISRLLNEAPTQKLGQKTFLRWLLGKPAILSLLLCALVQSTLTGCVVDRKNSRIINSREATGIWHSYEILPNYYYYFWGSVSQPLYIIGIDSQYRLTAKNWKPVDLTPAMLKNWFNFETPRVGYSLDPFGAFIVGPHDERIGLWYSVRDWRQIGAAKLDEDNQLSITTPPVTNPSKMRLFWPERYEWD